MPWKAEYPRFILFISLATDIHPRYSGPASVERSRSIPATPYAWGPNMNALWTA